MNDPEFITLRNQFFFGIGVALVFILPLFFVFKNKLQLIDSNIIKKIENNSEMILWITGNECNNCKNIEEWMKENKIAYTTVNKDKDRAYSEILQTINISSKEIIPPTIIYIQNGKTTASSVNIQDVEEIKIFLESYNLIR